MEYFRAHTPSDFAGHKVLAVRDYKADTDVEYLRDYDEKWAVISYNGQEAYVSRDFIRQVSQ